MIHRQTRVDHFQFWILHSIEFQINLITQRLGELESPRARTRGGAGRAAASGRSKPGRAPRRPAGG
jgi:hypothetical protein